ncbi:hypothetical protein BH23DEI1_BH23DEI1_13040 [soil metagenome]
MHRPHTSTWRALALALLLGSCATVLAQECRFEVEPNDVPGEATALAGLPCLVGELDGVDQDAFEWSVVEDDAFVQWQLEIQGIAGQLTQVDVLDVEYAADGVDVAGAETLTTWGTTDGVASRSAPFLMRPGTFVLGISKSGGAGEYVVHLRRGSALTSGGRPLRGETQEGEHALYGLLDDDARWAWNLDDDLAGLRWEIRLRGPVGPPLAVELLAPDGTTIDRSETGPGGAATLSSLGLQSGVHTIAVTGVVDRSPVRIDVVPMGHVTDGDEIEPNDTWETANLLTFDAPLAAAGPGQDRFLIEVGPDVAGVPHDLVVESGEMLRLSLVDSERVEVQTRRGVGGTLRALTLDEGSYGLIVTPGDGPYTLRFEPVGAAAGAGHEREPNDALHVASAMSEDHTLRGELAPQDVDVARFVVEGEPGIWRIQAIGEGLTEIVTFDGGGARQASVQGGGRLRLDNLVLAPGEHFVRLSGEGEYAVRAIHLGPVPPEPEPDPTPHPAPLERSAAVESAPTAERADPATIANAADPGPPPPPGRLESEPNDHPTVAELLRPGLTVVGTLPTTADRDLFRFVLAHDQYVRIEAVPPAEGQVAFDTSGARRAVTFERGEPAVLERWLLAGDYEIRLWATEPSDGWYQIRISVLDPLRLPDDLEPNDTEAEAVRLPADLTVEGRVGEMSDRDFFALPRFDRDATVRLDGDLGDVQLTLFSPGEPVRRSDDGSYEATLPAGEATFLRIAGTGSYRLVATFDPPPDPEDLRPPRDDPGFELTSSVEVVEVAAYASEGQVVRGELEVTNPTDVTVEVRFEAATSHLPVHVDLPASVTVLAGATDRVAYRIDLPPDVWDDQPIRVTLGARSDGGVATVPLAIAARCELPLLEPRLHIAVPDAFRGLLNVAWDAFGATVMSDVRNDLFLNDGHSSPGLGSYRDLGEGFTIDLPGDEPFRLIGTLLHPQSRTVGEQVRRFEVLASMDGERFEHVIEGTLAAARVEQAFAFDEPVEARFVRLVPLDAQTDRDGAWVGEWKLLAEEPAALGPFDIADARLGGLQVWSDPLLPSNALLAGGGGTARLDGRGFEEATWVIGFQHGRAARIDRLEWLESESSVAERWFQTARIEASLAGPVGPWTEVAQWTLKRGAEGLAVVALEGAPWARYLRVTAGGHDRSSNAIYAPATFRVIERAADVEYASILGEWGHYAAVGPFEAAAVAERGAVPVALLDDDGSDDARSGARMIVDGERVHGSVLVTEDEDWFRIIVPDDANLLELRLDGDSGAVRHRLLDADERPVPHELVDDGDGVTLTAFVDPGTYYLHLDEPKRSVVFSWDTSGSVGRFEPITYASIASFARDVDPEREAVQMLAFDDPTPRWLMPYWSSDPAHVSRALAAFDRATVASSEAEIALLDAVRALGQRDGTRAVLFITDHESGSYDRTARLWRAIESARPRIFTFEVSSKGSGITQDRMQAYAAANGGSYAFARGVGDFDVGFRRASCHLRRPKTYTLEVAVRQQEPPGPGQLSVRHAEGAALPGVEIVFDASGSMGALLPSGESRIDAARAVLTELVDEILPEGAPFALRVFGHLTPQSCETRLDIPLAPLDRAAARAAIAAIEPKLLSQTPIADALLHVADDLGGGGSVILITDGEESCGGDPSAVLTELRERGIDVTVSIVSLGIGDEEVRARLESLAHGAGGSYVGADDPASLRDAIAESLETPFEVLDAAGGIVARGRVGGDAIELPMGVYTLRVAGSPPTVIRDVRVPGDGASTVTVDAR